MDDFRQMRDVYAYGSRATLAAVTAANAAVPTGALPAIVAAARVAPLAAAVRAVLH